MTNDRIITACENADKVFEIPVVWEMRGKVAIKANSFEEAVKYAVENSRSLPLGDDAEYIEDSYQIDGESDNQVGDIAGIVETLVDYGYGEPATYIQGINKTGIEKKLTRLDKFYNLLGVNDLEEFYISDGVCTERRKFRFENGTLHTELIEGEFGETGSHYVGKLLSKKLQIVKI